MLPTTASLSSSLFISQKLRHVKWLSCRPELSLLLVASWDDESKNKVRLLVFNKREEIKRRIEDCHHVNIDSDISGLQVVSNEVSIVSTVNSGDLLVIAIDNVQRSLVHKATINMPQRCSRYQVASCQSLSSLDGLCVSASDCGSLDLVNIGYMSGVRSWERIESANINDLVFAHHNEVVTASSRGSIKLFDLKSSSNKPSSHLTLSSSSEVHCIRHLAPLLSQSSLRKNSKTVFIGIRCLSRHPSLSHVLASGNCDGTLAFFDLRKTGYPITILKPHDRPINHVGFHPLQPEHLFTCSEKGELLHWDASSLVQINFGAGSESMRDVVWFQAEAVQRRVNVSTTLSTQCLPLNSLDVASNGDLVAGGDNEAIYVVSNCIAQGQ